MLKGFYFESELIGEIDQHDNLVRAIAVRVHKSLPLENFNQRLQLEVAPRRYLSFLVGAGTVFGPRSMIIARPGECVSDYFLDSHSRGRIATLRTGSGLTV